MNYFWSTSGLTGNPGTQISPKRNMSEVLALLGPGDVGYGRGGTYQEWSDNAVPGGNSWNDPVTVAAFDGEPVILQPSAGADRCFSFYGAATKYIVINGFILNAVNASYDVVKITSTAGAGTSAHHIRLQNCELKNARNNGVLVSGSGGTEGGNEFISLHVHHNATFDFNPHGYGFYLEGPNNLIELCDIHDQHAVLGGSNSSGGIQVYNTHDSTGAGGNVIRRTKVYNHQYGGVILTSGEDIRFYNNLLWNNHSALVVDYGAVLAKIWNNSVYKNTNNPGIGGYDAGGILIGPGADRTIAQNNISYLNAINYRNLGSSTTQSNNLTDGTNPLFVDPDNGDFRLQGGSPAINAGADLSAYFTDDYNGFARG